MFHVDGMLRKLPQSAGLPGVDSLDRLRDDTSREGLGVTSRCTADQGDQLWHGCLSIGR